MREWLLKDEKAKVGRPKLADTEIKRRAIILLLICLLACFILSFCFVCTIKQVKPVDYAIELSKSKLSGIIKNKEGFDISEKYKDNNYIIKVKVPSTVSRYSGNYKYTLYELKKDKYKELDSKEYDNKTKEFDIIVKQKRNRNVTYKVKIELINASKVTKSFAPNNWKFQESSDKSLGYAYNIFTVKGYYSPISSKEYKEIKDNEEKINIITDELNPRNFVINSSKIKYDYSITYTDQYDKKVSVKKIENVIGKSNYVVPNINKISIVTIKIWPKEIDYKDIEKYKLSNYELKKDSNGSYYYKVSYNLKPEANYK